METGVRLIGASVGLKKKKIKGERGGLGRDWVGPDGLQSWGQESWA